jgi:hypothetical protein
MKQFAARLSGVRDVGMGLYSPKQCAILNFNYEN